MTAPEIREELLAIRALVTDERHPLTPPAIEVGGVSGPILVGHCTTAAMGAALDAIDAGRPQLTVRVIPIGQFRGAARVRVLLEA